MNTTNIIILVILIIVFLTLAFIIFFKIFNDKIKDIVFKIEETSDTCKEKIKEKYSILIEMINAIEKKLNVQSKTFDKLKKMNIDNINLFKNDKEFIKCYNDIKNIIEDNNDKKVKGLKNLIEKYEKNEIHIISLRTYYNKNIIYYNNLINKFPYNVISFLKKYKLKLLFEGKEIEVEN